MRFFYEIGFDVVTFKGLKYPTAGSIAYVTESELPQALIVVDSPEFDALVQTGTNLGMLRLADETKR